MSGTWYTILGFLKKKWIEPANFKSDPLCNNQGEQQALTGALDDLETRLAEATGQLEAEKRTRVQVRIR